MNVQARPVAALNHADICTLYDVGPNYLVMEFVDGAPIATTNKFPSLLDLAIQTADGLAAGSRARARPSRPKPANILVAPQQRVKILDFGAPHSNARWGHDPTRNRPSP